jgi:hypothetical protein
MFNYRIYTNSHVYSFRSETMSEAIQEFNKYHTSFSIIAIQDIRENKLITNNIPCLIGNLNNQLF